MTVLSVCPFNISSEAASSMTSKSSEDNEERKCKEETKKLSNQRSCSLILCQVSHDYIWVSVAPNANQMFIPSGTCVREECMSENLSSKY